MRIQFSIRTSEFSSATITCGLPAEAHHCTAARLRASRYGGQPSLAIVSEGWWAVQDSNL
jgi:hypothetical protein